MEPLAVGLDAAAGTSENQQQNQVGRVVGTMMFCSVVARELGNSESWPRLASPVVFHPAPRAAAYASMGPMSNHV